MKTMIATLALCGLVMLAPLVATASEQERQAPQFLDDACLAPATLLALIDADHPSMENASREEFQKFYEEAHCDCDDLLYAISFAKDVYERGEFGDDPNMDNAEFSRILIDHMQRKFNQECDEWQAMQNQATQNKECIIAGEHNGMTMGLGARPLDGDADSRIFLFLDEAAVEAAQSFVEELNKLDHEGDLPSEWELRCR